MILKHFFFHYYTYDYKHLHSLAGLPLPGSNQHALILILPPIGPFLNV